MTITLQSDSEARTRRIAAALAKRLRGGETIALEGQLGAGKTCFVRGLAEGLGLDPSEVSSPTFVICQEYGRRQHSTGEAAVTLVHIDAYRMTGPADLETIGWDEVVSDHASVIAVEWPSRIAAALPPQRIDVQLDHVSDHERRITIAAPATLTNRLGDLTAPAESAPAARCRTCGRPIALDGQHLPFCSERCRLADLGKWFNESYRTSRAAEQDDELE